MDRHWLLTASIGGQPLRWSSEPLEIIDRSGRSLHYRGGLTVQEVEQAVKGPGQMAQPPRAGFTAAYPEDIDYHELVAAGHSIAEETAELALWSPGQTFEERRIMLIGHIDEDEMDIESQPIRGTLTAPEWVSDGVSQPDAEARVDFTTWPIALTEESWIGAVYPIPIGRPGVGDSGSYPGSPAIPVQLSLVSGPTLLLIADRPVAAAQVRLWYGEDMEDGGLFAVTTSADGRGRVVALVDISAASAAIRAAGVWAVSWEEGAGILGSDGTAIETLGDALFWAAETSGLDLDLVAWRSLRSSLRGCRIGAVINSETPVWRWAEEVLLTIPPIEIVQGPSGPMPMIWDYDATADDAVAHLEHGRNVSSAGPEEASKLDAIRNQWRLRFAVRPDGEAASEVVVGAADRSCPDCTVSQARYGVIESELDLIAIARESAATLAAGWRVASLSRQHVTTTYGGLADDIEHLRAGDVVTITHAERGWLARVVHVLSVRWISTDEIELVLLDRRTA